MKRQDGSENGELSGSAEKVRSRVEQHAVREFSNARPVIDQSDVLSSGPLGAMKGDRKQGNVRILQLP